MIKLAAKLVVGTVVAAMFWAGAPGNWVRENLPLPDGQTFATASAVVDSASGVADTASDVADTASGLSSVISKASSAVTSVVNFLNPGDHDHTGETTSCTFTLAVPESGPRDGLVTDLRAAAQDLSTITGVQINVTRDSNPATDPTVVPVRLLGNQKIADLNGGAAAYALHAAPAAEGLNHTMFVNKDRIYELFRGTGTGTRYNVLLHELGHIVGVGHSTTEGDLMHGTPSLSAGITDADRTALRAATADCRS